MFATSKLVLWSPLLAAATYAAARLAGVMAGAL